MASQIFMHLKNIEFKKDRLRKAILTLAVDWKDLDDQLDSTKDYFDSCATDLELKQKDLDYNQESVAKSFRELDEVRESLDLRLKELELREEKFHSFQQTQVSELGKKEKQLGEIRVWIEEKMGECEMKEENLFVQRKSMELLLQNIETEKKEFEVIQKSVGEKLKEVHLKERNYESMCKEVSSIQDRMKTWANELGSKEEQLKELHVINEVQKNKLDIITRECELEEERLSVETKLMGVKLEKFEMEKELFENCKKSLDEKMKEICSKEQNCENLLKEVNLIQDWTERRSRELYSKEEEFTLREEQLNVRQKLNEELREELDVVAREYKLKEKKLEMENEEFQNIKNLVDKRWNEISVNEKYYEERCAEDKLTLDQIEKRAKELDSREEQVVVREEKLQAMQKLNKECCEELNAVEKDCKMKEERLCLDRKSLEEHLERIEKEKEHFEGLKSSFAGKLNEISLKERTLEDRLKELNSIQDWIERRAKELDLGEEQFAVREENLRMEKKSMEVLSEKIAKEKEDIEDSKKSVAEKLNEISMKERNYENLSKEVKLMLDGIESRATELEWREKQIALREEQEQLPEKLNKDCCEEVDMIVSECKLKKEKLYMERKSIEVLFGTIENDKKQFENCKRSVHDKFIEISVKEKNCEHLSKEVSLVLGQIERQAREFDTKDEQFVLREDQLMAMKKLNKERCDDLFVLIQESKFIEERMNLTKNSMEVLLEVIEKDKETGVVMQQCNLKEETQFVENKLIKVILEKVEKLKKEFAEIQNSVGKKLNEISLKERNYEDLFKDVKFILNRIWRQSRNLDSEVGKLSSRKEQLKPMQKLNGEHNQELEILVQEIDSAKRLSTTQDRNFDLKQKKMEIAHNNLHKERSQFSADQKLFEERYELESKEKLVEEHAKDLELKQKQLKETTLENLCNEKQFNSNKAEQVEKIPRMNLPKEIQDLVTLDGRGLQLYVNEHERNHSFSINKLCEILKSSSDPAKLVLDAMEGFYPPHLKKGDVEFKTEVVSRSCILLLEQLMMLSPPIHPHVREAAFRLACEWKVKMEVNKEHSEVLGFIQLLASYKLASDFDADQLLEYFEFFAARRLAPELCRALEISKKVPDLITSLIRNNKHWVAVDFILEFELAEKFPPVPLLRDYLRLSKKLIKNNFFKDYNAAKPQVIAINERIACVRNIMNCIKSHKLECGNWYIKLGHMLRNFMDQKKRRSTEPTPVVKNTVQIYHDNNFVRYTNGPDRMSKKGFCYLLADMDGDNLLLFLNRHKDEHGHLRKEVSVALRILFDSAKIVLDAIKAFYNSHLMKACSNIEASLVRSCNLLLEELMRISPVINPQLEKVARDIAVGWKLILVKQTTDELTLGFLLFVSAYGLSSTFDSCHLLKLYQTVEKHKLPPQLFHALGFFGEIPVRNNLGQWANKNLQQSKSASAASAINSHSSWDGIPDTVRYDSDPAQLVLDVVKGCYYSMLKNRKVSKVEMMKSFNFLLSRLIRVPLVVKPETLDQAKDFVAVWKGKVKKRHSLEVGCFLLLLATYKLLSSFPTDELFNLLEIVYDDRMGSSFFQSLALSEEVPDIIRRLIDRGQQIGAIKYIYAFCLVEKISPFPLLEDYINGAKEEAQKVREKGQDSPSARNTAIQLELNAYKAVMNCVKLHRLEQHYPIQNLKALVEQMEKQVFVENANKKRKCDENFVHDLQSSASFEPHLSKKQLRAAKFAKRMKFNRADTNSLHHHTPPCECPVEPRPCVVPTIGDYSSGASYSVFPYMNQYEQGGIPNSGRPPLHFGDGASQ